MVCSGGDGVVRFDLARRLDDALRQPAFDQMSQSVQDAVVAAREAGGEPARSFSDFLNGTWLGHSLHASLSDATIGLLLSAGVLDYLSLSRDDEGYCEAAATLLKLGLLSVVPTALAGLADWQYQMPRGRRYGFLHAVINSSAASLLAGSLLARRGHAGRPTPLPAALLSGAGLSALMAGAYIGGDLVFRFAIAVNADARVSAIDEFTPVMAESELAEGQPLSVEVKGRSLALVKQGGRLYALDNTCAHAGCDLARGKLGEGTITCPCHGSTYHLADGSIVTGPTTSPQHAYETRVRDGQVEVRSSAGVWMA